VILLAAHAAVLALFLFSPLFFFLSLRKRPGGRWWRSRLVRAGDVLSFLPLLGRLGGVVHGANSLASGSRCGRIQVRVALYPLLLLPFFFFSAVAVTYTANGGSLDCVCSRAALFPSFSFLPFPRTRSALGATKIQIVRRSDRANRASSFLEDLRIVDLPVGVLERCAPTPLFRPTAGNEAIIGPRHHDDSVCVPSSFFLSPLPLFFFSFFFSLPFGDVALVNMAGTAFSERVPWPWTPIPSQARSR